MDAIKELLIQKYGEIENRIMLVLDQLNDDQIHWRPNDSSNSIAILIVHICGNINERIGKGINDKHFIRDRDQEFEENNKTISDLKRLLREHFEELIETTKQLHQEDLNKTQMIRNRARTNLDVLLQCATHFSEHMGQIFYIAKIILNDKYITTSIRKKKRE